MTNPTADAIAALTHAAERLRILSNGYSGRADDAGRLAGDMVQISAYCREASAELLSAQGQAGKPDAMRKERDRAYEQSANDLARLTTARTALEAAEKALEEAQFAQSWSAPFAAQIAAALAQIDAILTEKDDGHGRG